MMCFIARYMPKVPIKHLEDPIITMTIVLLCTPTHIKNPYLTAKLVEVGCTKLANPFLKFRIFSGECSLFYMIIF